MSVKECIFFYNVFFILRGKYINIEMQPLFLKKSFGLVDQSCSKAEKESCAYLFLMD